MIFTKEESQSNRYDMERSGILHTRVGDLMTPFFMPDATRASVRGLTNQQLKSVGIHPMVVNTYHLMLQPGQQFLHDHGGVHNLMQWDGPLLSDSGGYQVYSLIHKNKELGKITEQGAHFRSVIDGSKHILTPQKAIEIQFAIGSDMMIVLDDPRPPDAPRQEHEAAVQRTVRWAQECRDYFDNQCLQRGLSQHDRPLLFAVVQGGPYVQLRQKCAAQLAKIGFDGYGFGGRHIDSDGNFMEQIIRETAAAIPDDAPRFALGIGTPHDIVRCYRAGWDMFDCVIPSREGRHGRIFTWSQAPKGNAIIKSKDASDFYDTINISNAKFVKDFTPLDSFCKCYACKTYTKSYIRHLFHVGEPLGAQMASLHNLHFYTTLMEHLSNTK